MIPTMMLSEFVPVVERELKDEEVQQDGDKYEDSKEKADDGANTRRPTNKILTFN